MVYKCIQANELDRVEYIRRGEYAKLFKVQWKGTLCVLKRPDVHHIKLKEKDELMHEAQILSTLTHKNIIDFYGVHEDESSILLEFMSNGSLNNFIDGDHDVPMTIRFSLLHDVACGMEYLHKNHILHKRLKTSNVLISKDYSGKVSDFQMSEKITISDYSRNDSNDVYSFAILIYEVWSGKINYSGIVNNISGEKLPSTDDLDQNMPFFDRMIIMLKNCWIQEPKGRPAFSKLCEEFDEMKLSHGNFKSSFDQAIESINSSWNITDNNSVNPCSPTFNDFDKVSDFPFTDSFDHNSNHFEDDFIKIDESKENNLTSSWNIEPQSLETNWKDSISQKTTLVIASDSNYDTTEESSNEYDFDICIISSNEDCLSAEKMKKELEYNIPDISITLTSYPELGSSKVTGTNNEIRKSRFIFIFLTFKFDTDAWAKYYSQIGLCQDIICNNDEWRIVPVLTEKNVAIPDEFLIFTTLNWYNYDKQKKRIIDSISKSIEKRKFIEDNSIKKKLTNTNSDFCIRNTTDIVDDMKKSQENNSDSDILVPNTYSYYRLLTLAGLVGLLSFSVYNKIKT